MSFSVGFDPGDPNPFPDDDGGRSPFALHQSALPSATQFGGFSFGRPSIGSSSGALKASTSSSSKSSGKKVDPAPKQKGLQEFTSLTTALKSNMIPKGDYPVDIVAIHALTGGSESTWEFKDGEKRVIWLRDFLPDDLPGARVFSYGYNAEIWNSLGTANFCDYAQELLASLKGGLKLANQEPDKQYRPIILVCHSMGGIVAKQALVTSCLQEGEYGPVRRAIFGIVFLATPHRGSSQGPLVSMLQNIVRIAHQVNSWIIPLLRDLRCDLIENLAKNSSTLTKLSDDSANLLKGLKIATFRETVKMRISGITGMTIFENLIVEEDSSTMGVPDEIKRPMTSDDHITICHFKDSADSRYQLVRDVLEGFAKEAVTTGKEEKVAQYMDAIVRSLGFKEIPHRRNDAARAHSNTCRWILSNTKFQTWLEGTNDILWIQGIPGAGKSTLLAWTYNYMKDLKSKSDLALDFFFHARGVSLQKNEEGMFRSFLQQLCQAGKSVKSKVASLYVEKMEIYGETNITWHVTELREIFTGCLLDTGKRRQVILFIDALDEAGTGPAKDLTSYFDDLNSQLVAANGSAKICISAHHHPILSVKVSLDICVEKENRHDIHTFVGDTLEIVKQKSKREDISSEDYEILHRRISNSAEGIFQWARLTVHLVSELIDEGESMNTIMRNLFAVPSELGNVYEHILKHMIRRQNLPRTLLLYPWVLFAERPLSVEELRWATACDGDIPSSIPKFKDEKLSKNIIDNATLIRTLSGGLIDASSLQSNVVQFIHESAREHMKHKGIKYLLQEVYKGHGKILHYTEGEGNVAGVSHARLARACISCLRQTYHLIPKIAIDDENRQKNDYFPRHHTNDVVSRSKPKDGKLVFLDYSERCWFRHSRRADLAGILGQNLEKQFGIECAAGKLVFETWSGRIRFRENRLSFRDLYNGLLRVQSCQNLLETVTLLVKHRVCFDPLGKYPDGVGENELNNWEPIHHAVSWGHLELVEAISKTHDISECTYSTGHTPVDIAAIYGHQQVLRVLLDRTSNDPSIEFEEAKQQPTFNSETLESVTKYIWEWGREVPRSDDDGTKEDPLRFSKIDTALRKAAREGNLTMVKQLLDWGFDPNVHGGVCGTALSDVAEARGDRGFDLVQLLLSYGSDLSGFAHCQACYCNPESSPGEFVEKGVCRTWVKVLPGQCPTPFSMVLSNGNKCETLVARLLEHMGLDEDDSDKCEDSLLHTAVRKGSPATKVIRRLIKTMNPDINIFNDCTFEEQNREERATGLEEYFFETVLQAAVGAGDAGFENVKLLIKKGANVNFRIPIEHIENPDFDGFINPDASYDVKEVGYDKYLWDEEEFDDRLKKATYQEPDQGNDWSKDVVWDRTALTRAAGLGDGAKKIVRLLLSERADPHLRRISDFLTPLQIAENLPGNNKEVVEMLRKAMVDPDFFVDDSAHSEASSNSSDNDGSEGYEDDEVDLDEAMEDENGNTDSEEVEWHDTVEG